MHATVAVVNACCVYHILSVLHEVPGSILIALLVDADSNLGPHFLVSCTPTLAPPRCRCPHSIFARVRAGAQTRRKRRLAEMQAASAADELASIRAVRQDRSDGPESVVLDWGDLLCDDLSVENEAPSSLDLSG